MAHDAGLPVTWWSKAFESGEHREWRELQQFAEFIVQECMSIAGKVHPDDLNHAIKEHFGIK